jgi:phosphopantetheine adenylyltransferase
MLVESCVDNYATFDGLVNGVDDIFKASTTYCEKIIIWIMFQNSKIGTITLNQNGHQLNLSSKI